MKAATELVCDRGYTATGVDAICAKAGVAKTALYWHFGNKAGLVAAVVDELCQSWVDAIAAQVAASGTPFERLDQLLVGLRDIVENRAHLLAVVQVVVNEAAHLDEAVVDAIRRLDDAALGAIAEGFREVVEEVPDADLIGVTVIALLHEIHRRRSLYGDAVDLDRYFADMRQTIIASVAARFRD